MPSTHQRKCDSCGGIFATEDAGGKLCSECSHPAPTIITKIDDTANDGVATTNFGGGADFSAGVPKSRPVKPAGKKIGRFEVRANLGFGSFGNVVRAYDPMLDREIALKVPLFPPDQPELVERFQREAKAAARLRHPNIVTTFECGKVGENYYIATEFVDGMPLSKKISKGGFDHRQAVQWVRELADALTYAHGEQVVHRDIKPANIMLSSTGRPELMDFGLAKVQSEDDGMTIDGSVVGTPSYMAPEQARGDIKATGPHSDQYSLGAVLYELLTKQRPFSGAMHTVISAVAGDVEPEPIRKILPGVSADLEAICEKALSKAPEDRYPSTAEFSSDLEHWLNGEPILARRINVVERLWRWCRRNRAIASLLFVVATMLLVGAIASAITAVSFRSLAQKAELRLADMFTFTGLAAAKDGDPAQAVLWFANAAERSQSDPRRERANRIRFNSWANATPITVRAMEHPGEYVEQMEFDQSGRFLLVLTHDFDSYLWDVTDGQLIKTPNRNPQASAAAWSQDGSWLAQGFDEGIEINAVGNWESVEREQLPGRVECLAFSPDGAWLAVATSDGSENLVRLWNCVSREFAAPIIQHLARVRRLAFGAHSGMLATSCADGSTQVYSIPLTEGEPKSRIGSISNYGPVFPKSPDAPVFIDDDKALITLPEIRPQSATAFATSANVPSTTFALSDKPGAYFNVFTVSPDRRYLVAGTSTGAALWDVASRSRVGAFMPHTNIISSLAMHRDGHILLTGSLDRTARLWEIPSGQPISPKIAHQDEVRAVAFSPHEDLFATCQNDGLVKVWRFLPNDPDDIQHALGWHDAFLQQSADGRFVIPSGWNYKRTSQALRVFDATTGRQTGKPIKAAGLLNAAAISPTGDIVMGLSSQSTDPDEANASGKAERMLRGRGLIELWDRGTGTARTDPLEAPSEPIAGAFHPTRPLAAILCAGGHLLWINTESGQVDEQSLHEGEFRPGFLIRGYLKFAPNGESLATWGLGKTATVWDVATGERRFTIEKINAWCSDVTFSGDGSLMVVSGADNRIQIVRTENGEHEVPPLVQPNWVFTSSFNADEQLLLTAGRDRIARVWDWRAGTLAGPELEHDDEVFDAQFCDDGDCVITACRDGSVRFWDRHSGRPLAPTRILSGQNYCVLLSLDGRRAFVSGRNENVNVLSLSRLLDTEPIDATSHRRLAELIAGRRQLENGGVASLTSAECQERWRSVQSDGSLDKIIDLNIVAKP